MGYEKPVDYKEVPERIADLKAKHPDARLRPVNPDKPFDIVTVDDKTFIVYAAACYLAPDDPLPGIGVAWEPFPGRTPYTKDSELMNAETSAWGRAIVAALRSESKMIASAEEVRNRREEPQQAPLATQRAEQHGTVRQPPRQETGEIATEKQLAMMHKLFTEKGIDQAVRKDYVAHVTGRTVESTKELTKKQASAVIDALMAEPQASNG